MNISSTENTLPSFKPKKNLAMAISAICLLMLAGCSGESGTADSRPAACWVETEDSARPVNAREADRCISDTPEYKTKLDEGFALRHTDPEGARKIAEELFIIFDRENDAIGKAQTRRLIASSYAPNEDWDTARKYFLEAQSFLNEADHLALYARNLQSIGATFINVGQYGGAFEYTSQALSVSEKYDHQPGIARSNYLLGTVMINVYDNEAAIGYLTTAIENEAFPESTLASAYTNLANAYRYDGQIEKSLPFYEMAIDVDPDQSPHTMAVTYNYHAQALIEMERYDEAEVKATKALNLSEQNEFAIYICESKQSLGNIALARGDARKALNLLDFDACGLGDAPEEYLIATDISILPTTIEALLSLGQTEKAQEAFDRLLIRQEENFNSERANSFGIAEARLRLAEGEGRIEFLEQQDKINSANLQRSSLIALLAVLATLVILVAGSIAYRNYRVQKQANDLLVDKDIRVTNKVLAAEKSLEHKTLLIHEINHRVKNNLQTIISLLNTQRRHLGSATTDAAAGILNDVRGRVETMAIVQQSLNEAEQVDRVDTNPFVSDLVARLIESSGRKIDVQQDIDTFCLAADTMSPVALIINELVSNALKHAFRGEDDNVLQIELKRLDASQFQLACQDNGAGLSPDFNLDQLDSFGLSIVQSLAEQIQGKLTLETLESGTRWIVTFQAEPGANPSEDGA